ncbi:MAG: Digeranylgeranylglycerophospholipid reductase [Methanosaeta sp. PtaB.Bin039]|nr:MAG: Digeranylgeranylglycerophospholipid reductase [Methanosaeta sp. PtaB.Bin039]OPY45716.1 MAG: Digeranylgeranylglycerophospholipid reductase [Methanosaeta sp. PtaU1.Bin028]HOT07744.1 NAD(P)/FAD-dependent oxidoreductase [Methanotrichaceae archaeon]HQF16965.1 NAD(P)/FAD-dependent oxidoreductase [Methanotrichaceae archaeon]HQI91585.1 NAD(P)/FAD-dependent oxidoreductase [Methanotrichaceae archaeon]
MPISEADITVIGASLAGIMAAISAAKAGVDTVLVERRPGKDRPANTVFLGMARGLEIDLAGFARHRLRGMRIISPAGHALEVLTEGYFLDRESLDRHLLDRALDLGAEVVEGEASAARSNDGWTVRAGGRNIESRIVIDAGGVDSAIAIREGLKTMLHPEDVAWAMDALVEHPGIGEEDLFEYWVGSLAPGWKATFSPGGGNLATLGVFVRGRGRDVRPYLDRFVEIFKRHKAFRYDRIRDLRILDIRSGGDPIAALPGQMVADGLMVTGGAAAQSGLAYSMRAGLICGNVAASAVRSGDTSKEALLPYPRLWHKELGMEYRLGRAALQTLSQMSDQEIDRMAMALGGKDLLAGGSLYGRTFRAGLSVALANPGAAARLIGNLLRD